MRKVLFAVFALAVMQAQSAFAVERDVIDRARVAFSEQLQLLSSRDGEYEWVSEDAVYQYPLHDINVKLRVEGRDAIIEHLNAIAGLEPATIVENLAFYPTLDRETVLVQYDVVGLGADAERRRVAAIIEMRGDQIASFIQLNTMQENLQVVKKAADDLR